MTKKEITVVRYSYRLVNSEWAPAVDLDALKGFVESLHKDLKSHFQYPYADKKGCD